jgi:hypothetical protein
LNRYPEAPLHLIENPVDVMMMCVMTLGVWTVGVRLLASFFYGILREVRKVISK